MKKQFKESNEYQVIIDKCKKILNKKACFSCFADNLIEFHYKKGEYKHIFCFISDDAVIKKMSIEWILSLERIKYFEYSKNKCKNNRKTKEICKIIFNQKK